MKRPLLPIVSLTVVALTLVAAAGCKRGGPEPTAATTNPAATTTGANAAPITAVPDNDRYKVTADTTGVFRYSPLQASGSDFDLKKNARLTMIKHGRGFCQIKTADGQVGYVGTEDIAPLAPSEIAQEDAATLQAAQAAAGAQLTAVTPASNAPVTTRSGKKSSAVEGSYTIPSAADINTRLPEPDARPKATPTPSPTVNFR